MVQPLVLGKRFEGRLESMPWSYLKGNESVMGAVYEIQVYLAESLPLTVRDGTDKPTVTQTLLEQMPYNIEGFKIDWIEVGDNTVKMQVTGSPFPWAAVIAFLPEILALIGLTVTAIGVFLVISYVPRWVAALLGVGALLLIIGIAPTLTGILKRKGML